jgi:hypothetical protein
MLVNVKEVRSNFAEGCGSFETTGARVAHSHPNSHCVTRNFVETLTFLKV